MAYKEMFSIACPCAVEFPSGADATRGRLSLRADSARVPERARRNKSCIIRGSATRRQRARASQRMSGSGTHRSHHGATWLRLPLARRTKKAPPSQVARNFSATGGGGQKIKPAVEKEETQKRRTAIELKHIA